MIKAIQSVLHRFLPISFWFLFCFSFFLLFLREVVPQVMENESDVRCLQMIKLKKSGRYELFLPTNKQLPTTSRSVPSVFLYLSYFFSFSYSFPTLFLPTFFSFFFTLSLLSITLSPRFSLFNFSLTFSSSLRLLLHLQLFLLISLCFSHSVSIIPLSLLVSSPFPSLTYSASLSLSTQLTC